VLSGTTSWLPQKMEDESHETITIAEDETETNSNETNVLSLNQDTAITMKDPSDLVKPFEVDLLMNFTKNGFNTFRCWICKEDFQSKKELSNHRKLHFQMNVDLTKDDESGTYFSCDYCSKTFSKRVNMAQHYKFVHCSPKFQCHLCPHRCSTKQLLVKHVETHSIMEEVFANQPKVVKEVKGNKETVKKSKKIKTKISEDNKHFSCYHCSKKFGSMKYLKIHYTKVHCTPTLLCTLCPQKCSTRQQMEKHMETHLKDRTQLKISDSLKGIEKIAPIAMKKVKVPKQYQCTECPKTFSMKGPMMNHIKSHKNIRNDEIASIDIQIAPEGYPCSICPRQFKTKGNLANHMRGHRNKSETVGPLFDIRKLLHKKKKNDKEFENEKEREIVEDNEDIEVVLTDSETDDLEIVVDADPGYILQDLNDVKRNSEIDVDQVKAAENIEDDIRVEDEVFIVHTKSVNEDDAEKQPNSGQRPKEDQIKGTSKDNLGEGSSQDTLKKSQDNANRSDNDGEKGNILTNVSLAEAMKFFS